MASYNGTSSTKCKYSWIYSAISAYYARKFSWTGGLTVRDWLANKSFDEQIQFGMNYLKNFGEVVK